MLGLLDLPQELWSVITNELDLLDMKALAVTCWTTYHYTVPALYRSLDTCELEDQVIHTPWLSSVALALMYRPALRPLVKNVSYTFFYVEPGDAASATIPMIWTRADLEKASEVVQETSSLWNDPAALLVHVEMGHMDAMMAFTLSLMPNLDNLSLPLQCMTQEWHFVASLIKQVARSLRLQQPVQLFTSLQRFYTIGLGYQEERFWPDWDAMKALFYLPKVNEMWLILPDPWEWEWPDGHAPQSAVRNLIITRSEISMRHLSSILQACPQLEMLSYEAAVLTHIPLDPHDVIENKYNTWYSKYGDTKYPHPRWSESNPCNSDFTAFTNALAPLRSTLKKLTLRITPIFISPTMPHEIELQRLCTGNLLELHDMEALEELDIPTDILTCHLDTSDPSILLKILPPNIKRLFLGAYAHPEAELDRDRAQIYDDIISYVASINIPSNATLYIVDDRYYHDRHRFLVRMMGLCRKLEIPYELRAPHVLNCKDPQTPGPWCNSWRGGPDREHDLEDMLYKGVRTFRKRRQMPDWLETFAETVTPEMLEDLSDSSETLSVFEHFEEEDSESGDSEFYGGVPGRPFPQSLRDMAESDESDDI